MQFDFATASRIIFGPGKLSSLPDLVKQYDEQILVISGAPSNITGQLLALLNLQADSDGIIPVNSEPTVVTIRTAIQQARQVTPRVVIGVGGGSAIDTAKAVAILLNNPGDVTDYLEVIGPNKPIMNASLPLIAIPTTAGTGSEATRNAVIGSPTDRVKVSLRSPFMLPRIALIDPELTLRLPPSVTATTGLDALTQLIEPYTSNSSNPITDALCMEGIQRIARSIYSAYDDGADLKAREDLSIAALFSGIALANARLGVVHGFAGAIGGEIAAHHGAICASLLSAGMSTNISALQHQSPHHPILNRYMDIARHLTGKPDASAEDGIGWVQNFCTHAHIRPLSQLGLTELQFTQIISQAQKSSSMKGNPITLSEAELRNILEISY